MLDAKEKETNIEKYDFEAFEKEKKPYTHLLNSVIQNIKNPQAFLIWAFLQSLPEDWIPSKNHIMKHFDLSERVYQRIMCFLNEHKLIEYRRNRNSNGTLGKIKLIVLNGINFIPDTDFNQTAKNGGVVKVCNKNDLIVQPNQTAKKPHCGETTPVAFGDVTNTTDLQIQKLKETNKTFLCESEKEIKKLAPIEYPETYYQNPVNQGKPNPSRFEEFWTLYPNKKNKERARCMWENSNLDDKVDVILDKLQQQIEYEAQWKDKKYIPNPSNYINDQRWEDEIISKKQNQNKSADNKEGFFDYNNTEWSKDLGMF